MSNFEALLDEVTTKLDKSETTQSGIRFIPHDKITPDHEQSRDCTTPKVMEHIKKLAASMSIEINDPDSPNKKKPYGIREPLSIKHDAKKDEYKIVKGECRWRAAKIAGIENLPCIIQVYGSEDENRYDHITENTLRKSLNLYETAKAIDEDLKNGIPRKNIIVIYNLKNDSQVSKFLSLLKVDVIIQDATKNEDISDINMVYDLKALTKENLIKWKKHVDNGESSRSAYLKVAPKASPKKSQSSKNSVTFSIEEAKQLIQKLGVTTKIKDAKQAKSTILEHIND